MASAMASIVASPSTILGSLGLGSSGSGLMAPLLVRSWRASQSRTSSCQRSRAWAWAARSGAIAALIAGLLSEPLGMIRAPQMQGRSSQDRSWRLAFRIAPLPIAPAMQTSAGSASTSHGTPMVSACVATHHLSCRGRSSIGNFGAAGGSPSTPGSGQSSAGLPCVPCLNVPRLLP